MENTNPTATAQSSSIWGHWREKIDAEFDYVSPSEFEAINIVSEVTEKATEPTQELIKLTDKSNSFAILQEIKQALEELLNDDANSYDWKDYADGFDKVLEANTQSKLSVSLYRSNVDDLLNEIDNGEDITEKEISKAIAKLDDIIENSSLLENPTEVKQISFFDTFNEPENNGPSTVVSENESTTETVKTENSPMGNSVADASNYAMDSNSYKIEGGPKAR